MRGLCPQMQRRGVGVRRQGDEHPQVLAELEGDEPFYRRSQGGITVTGGEPTQQPAFVIELARACRNRGWHVALETCGYCPVGTFLRVASEFDLILFDVKALTKTTHEVFTGVANEMILSNLIQLDRAGAVVTVRIPLIPSFNADKEELTSCLAFFVRS